MRDFSAVSYRLNVKKQLQDSFQSHPVTWLAGATALGMILVRPRPRKKTRPSKALPVQPPSKKASRKENFLTFTLAVLRLLVPILKPALSAYAAKRLAGMAEKLAK